MSSLSGTELKRSKYRLLGLVGQGQFGRVFCATHRQTGRLVALKNLERQRFPTHKFLRELRFLLSLQHPNIVTCQALEHTATGRYLVMDYCEGGTLRSLMTEGRSLSLSLSLKLVMDILTGLEHAHSRNIVHCDIKPENILLNVQPDGWTARISDFGIARLSQEITGQETGNTGSPAYMAPERFYGQYSLTTDLYAVGVLLFELIAGHRPFSGTPAELMSAHLNRPVKMPDSIPKAWQPVILTALQKLSARRFRSAAEMLLALKAIAATENLDPEATRLFLLPAAPNLSNCPFQIYHQEQLRQPLIALAVMGQPRNHLPDGLPLSSQSTCNQSAAYLYRAAGNQVAFQIYKTGILAETNSASDRQFQPEIWHTAPLQAAVRQFLPRPQGCFVVTRRSVHLIPAGIEADPSLTLQLILAIEQDFAVAIEAQGRWLATLSGNSQVDKRVLAFQRLAAPSRMTLASRPVLLSIREQAAQSLQLFALDARHIAIFADLPAKQAAQLPHKTGENAGTLVKVMTRRGDRVGSLILPLQVGQVILTSTPYRFLATERNRPQSLLLIDLRPYRILRLEVEIAPTFLSATAWGYILADSQGQIILLDQDGNRVGCMASPTSLTAIASFNHYGLLVATWNGKQGNLHTLDLRESGADLLF